MPRAVGRRPPHRTEEPDPLALASRRQRAAEEPLDVWLREREPVVELEVRNPIHRTSYRVLFPEYPGRGSALCTCTDFAKRGLGTCKHLEAGWSWLEGRRELPAPSGTAPAPVGRSIAELWTEVERRMGAAGRLHPKSIRDVEALGRLLWEDGPGEGRTEDAPEKVGRAAVGRSPTTTSRGHP